MQALKEWKVEEEFGAVKDKDCRKLKKIFLKHQVLIKLPAYNENPKIERNETAGTPGEVIERERGRQK